MDIGARLHVFGAFFMLLMFVLTLADGFYAVLGLYILSCVGAGIRR
jgi:hypothetical protein